MMMQCPRCSTRWRVAVASPVDNPLFKCGRCHHLFRQFPGATPPADAVAAPSKRGGHGSPPEPDTLEFIFPDRQSPALVADEEPTHVAPAPTPAPAPVAFEAVSAEAETVVVPPIAVAPEVADDVAEEVVAVEVVDEEPDAANVGSEPDVTTEMIAAPIIVPRPDVPVAPAPPPSHARVAKPTPAMDDEAELDLEFGDDLLAEPTEDDELEVAADLEAASDERDEMVLGDVDDAREADDDEDEVEHELEDDERPAESTGRRFRVEDAMKAPAGFGTIMRAMGMAVSGFAVLALVIRVAPEHASMWLSYLPVAGQSFAKENTLSTKIELKNVQGRFQRLRNARRVFVISGDARNNSPMTIERIEVAGALYGLGGGELDERVVTTGNRTALTDLSEAEIVLLQRLDPVIALAPGETTPFLIVFLEPPRELREFSSRVLSVRPTRRASTPPSSRRDSVG